MLSKITKGMSLESSHKINKALLKSDGRVVGAAGKKTGSEVKSKGAGVSARHLIT